MIRGKIAPIGVLFAASLAALTIAHGLSLGGGPQARAEHSGAGVNLLAVDVNTAGNTATSFGNIDTCAEIGSGASLNVDVVVDAIPEDRPLTAFQFQISYDPAIVRVTDVDHEFLLAADGFQPFAILTDPRPDSDGTFLVAINDVTTNPESGPGVLARITLTAVGAGVTNLSPINIDLRDDRNERMPPAVATAANVAVGQACPSEEPTPISTRPPAERPEQSPTPAPGGIIVPGATPGDLPDASATPAPGTPDASDPAVLALEAKERLLESISAGINLDVSLRTVPVGGSTTIFAAFALENDEPLSDVDISFKIEEQPGDDADLDGEDEVTKPSDTEGVAEATLNVGSTPGKIVVSATAEDQTETVTITVIEEAEKDTDDDDGGVGAWIAAPIVAAVLALAAGGYGAYRWRRRRTAGLQ